MPNTLFQGKYFSIVEDDSGTEFVKTGDAVLIVPITAAGEVITIIEPAPAFGAPARLLPGGELSPGEAPEECANRELQEEIGLIAGKMDFLGELRPFSKYLTVRVMVFLARQLSASALKGDEDYPIAQMSLPLESAVDSIFSGAIQDSTSAAALLMAQAFLRKEVRED